MPAASGTTRRFPPRRLTPGNRLKGPALIIEANQTIVVEPGWQAAINARDHIVLTRAVARARASPSAPGRPDHAGGVQQPVHVDRRADGRDAAENRLLGQHQGAAGFLLRGVRPPTGALVANAPHMPVHLGSMDRSVEAIIRLNEGDPPRRRLRLNAPYNGGTHLPDITVVTPVFDPDGKTILFWVASRGHHADVGGTGARLDDAARHHRGRGRRADRQFQAGRSGHASGDRNCANLLTDHPYPCRNPQNIADLKAQIAANEKACRNCAKMVASSASTWSRPTWATCRTTPRKACAG
jgi:5-oxoprolinase (ATP-hydrolysing)